MPRRAEFREFRLRGTERLYECTTGQERKALGGSGGGNRFATEPAELLRNKRSQVRIEERGAEHTVNK